MHTLMSRNVIALRLLLSPWPILMAPYLGFGPSNCRLQRILIAMFLHAIGLHAWDGNCGIGAQRQRDC